jgi:hypothetical protein
MTALQILEVICPPLYNTENVQDHLDLASQGLSRCFFGDRYNEAVALMAAHRYVMNVQQGGGAGVVTYKAAGRYMQSLGGIGVIRKELELTNYGRQLQTIIDSRGRASTTNHMVASRLLEGC